MFFFWRRKGGVLVGVFFLEQKIGVLWAFFWSRKIYSGNFFAVEKRAR